MVEEELTEEQIAEFKKIDANVRKYFIDNAATLINKSAPAFRQAL